MLSGANLHIARTSSGYANCVANLYIVIIHCISPSIHNFRHYNI